MSAKKDTKEIKKFILLNIPYFILGYVADKICWLIRTAEGDASQRVAYAVINMGSAFHNPLPSIHPVDLLVGVGCGFLLRFIMMEKRKNAKKFRHGVEYGSARWGNSHRPWREQVLPL